MADSRGAAAAGCRGQVPPIEFKFPSTKQHSSMEAAVASGDLDRVRTLCLHVPAPERVEFVNSFSPALLFNCVAGGHTAIMELLLNFGADPNATQPDRLQNTPLHCACACLHTDCISILLKWGASQSLVNGDSALPFEVAPVEHQKPLIEWMAKVSAFFFNSAWVKASPVLTRAQRAAMRRSFDMIDQSSGDNHLDAGELAVALTESGEPHSHEQLLAFHSWISNLGPRLEFYNWFRTCARMCVVGIQNELEAKKAQSKKKAAADPTRPASAARAKPAATTAKNSVAAAAAQSNQAAAASSSLPPPPPPQFLHAGRAQVADVASDTSESSKKPVEKFAAKSIGPVPPKSGSKP